MLTIHRKTADGMPVANAVFTIASQRDSTLPFSSAKQMQLEMLPFPWSTPLPIIISTGMLPDSKA